MLCPCALPTCAMEVTHSYVQCNPTCPGQPSVDTALLIKLMPKGVVFSFSFRFLTVPVPIQVNMLPCR